MHYDPVTVLCVQSLLYHCTKETTVILHFISAGQCALIMAARYEWTVSAQLICVEFGMYICLELWSCRHAQGKGEVCQMWTSG